MSQRRGAGDGTVFRSADGRWVAMLELPRRSDGSRHRKKRRAKTRAEAQRLLREMRAELDAAGHVADGQRRISASIDAYRSTLSGGDLAPATLVRYEWLLGLIREHFGDRRASGITVTDCDTFLAAAATGLRKPDGSRGRPLAREQLGRLRSVLIAVLRNDIRLGALTSNVAALSVLPTSEVEANTRRALTADQLSDLQAAAHGADAILISLIGRHGLRPSEARAVRWACIDFDAKTLKVTNQINKLSQLVPPKTRKAGRTIRIDDHTSAALSTWAQQQASLRNYAGLAWIEFGLVATTSRGTPISDGNFRRTIRALCTRCGIDPPIVPYELRHTAITLQIQRRYPVWQVADWAGTSERMIYDTYRHTIDDVIDLPPIN